MPGQAKRHYSTIEDHTMLKECQTMHDLFEEGQADFENLDSDFAMPYITLWQQAIDEAESFPSDATIQYRISQATAAVEAKMKLCRNKFRKARHIIRQAFPNNHGVHNEFGFDDYDKARNNHILMILFMDRFHKIAMDNNTELIGAGYSQAAIDQIETLHDALNVANRNREMLKRKRKTTTQIRIRLLNTAWSFMAKTAKASRLIYKDDYAKFKQYLLPKLSIVAKTKYSPVENVRNSTVQDGLPKASAKSVSVICFVSLPVIWLKPPLGAAGRCLH